MGNSFCSYVEKLFAKVSSVLGSRSRSRSHSHSHSRPAEFLGRMGREVLDFFKRRLQIVRRSHYTCSSGRHVQLPAASVDCFTFGCTSSWNPLQPHPCIHSKNWKIYFLVLCDYISTELMCSDPTAT